MLEPGVILLVADALLRDSIALVIASAVLAIDPNVLVRTVASADKVMLVLVASALDSVMVAAVVVDVSEVVTKVVISSLTEVVVEPVLIEEMVPLEYKVVEVEDSRPPEMAVSDSRFSDPVEVKLVVIAWLPTPSSDVEVAPSGEDVESRDIVSSVIIDESGSVTYTVPVVVETGCVIYDDTGVFTVASVVLS